MTLSAAQPHAQTSTDILGAAPTPPTPPSHETLLASFAALNGDLTALCARHSLSGHQLLAFLEDQTIAPRRTAIDAALTQSTIRRLNNHAGEALIRAINNDGDPVELRRAATVLCRIARYYGGTALPGGASPRGTALQNVASSDASPLQSIASPGKSTSQSPSRPPAHPHAPPPTPSNPHYTAKAALRGMLKHLKDPDAAAHDTAPPLFRLGPGALLDNTPITREILADTDRLNDLVQDSTLGDIATRDHEVLPDPFISDTAATFRVLYPATPDFPDPIIATFHLTRDSANSLWLLAAISSTSRPTPTPCASSP